MRIGIDAREFGPRVTGIARWTANAVAGGAALGRADEIVAFVRTGPNGRPARLPFRAEAVEVPAGPAGDLRGLGRAARAAGVRAFLSPYYKVPVGLGVPAVAVVHDLIPLSSVGGLSLPRRLYFRGLLASSLRRSARVVAVSRHVAVQLVERLGLPRERVVVSPNAVAPVFHPRPAVRDFPRLLRYRLAPFSYVLCVSDDRPHKNLERLVEAWARAAPALPSDLRLAVTVEPSRAPGLLRALARCRLAVEAASAVAGGAAALGPRRPPETSGVVLLGPVGDTDLAALYRCARAVVHPALDEGFGLPVVEAMACGAPVAAAAAGALPEVAGGAALLFDPTDVGAIAEALRRAALDDDLRAGLRRAGLARAALFRPHDAARPLWDAIDAVAS